MFGFDKLVDRCNTGSIKWDSCPEWIKKEGYVPLSVADMEFSVAAEIKEALHTAVDKGIYGYTQPDKAYFSAVKEWMSKRHSWDIKAEWIICTGGVVPAIRTAIRAFSRPNDFILIQPPVYFPFAESIRINNRNVCCNPLMVNNNKYEMDFNDLREKIKAYKPKILILCSPHNPVGRVWEKDELKELGGICNENGVLVIADEIHFDIILPPHKHTVYASMGEDFSQNSITCTATSKTFNLAGLKNSNIIISNPELKSAYEKQLAVDGFYCINYFSYFATIAGYTHCDAWLEALIQYIQANYLYLKEALKNEFPEVDVFPLEGTYLAWTDWRKFGWDTNTLQKFIREQSGLILDEGSKFGENGSGFERWNLAVPQNVLKDSVRRLINSRKKDGF